MSEQSLNEIKEKIKRDGEELVLKGFPRKILDLNRLSNSDKYCLTSALKQYDLNLPIPAKSGSETTDEINKDENKSKDMSTKCRDKEVFVEDDELVISKPFLFPNGRVECNKQFVEMIDELKPKLIQLTEDILLLKLAVNLMVPKIEDGNNFGVEIQRETIETIQGFESQVLKHFDKFETYYETRGDLIAKAAKYPHNQDFRIAVQEGDQRFYWSLCLTLTDVRNYYVSLHDLVTKNMSKIKTPRNADNTYTMY